MLTSLAIRNFILIEGVRLSFGHKLSVLTGETGAGKSILLDAVAFALGARTDSGVVQDGADGAAVSLSFEFPASHPVVAKLAESGVLAAPESGPAEVVVRRALSKDGKGKAFINDVPVGLALLKSMGGEMVEIHGQFDGLSLLNPAAHMELLDDYARAGGLKSETRKAHAGWQSLKAARIKAGEEFAKAKEDEDYLRHNLSELEEFAPRPGEEAELDAARRLMMDSEKIITAIRDASGCLSKYGAEPEKFASDASRMLERIPAGAKSGPVRAAIAALESAASSLADASERLVQITEAFSFDGDALEKSEERLFRLRELARKHRVRPDDLPAFLGNLRGLVKGIDNSDAVLAERAGAEAAARDSYIAAAAALSSARKKSAAELGAKVMAELPPLKLEKATFEVSVEPSADERDFSPDGFDIVRFVGATNPSAKPNFIHKIASGGELARFTLAIKVVLAGSGSVPSIIFDEVDTGVSGATAAAVGERLAALGRGMQVMVITHSPQVAACGNHHFKVSKSFDEERGRTITSVDQLSEQQRVMEIARIISGDRITGEAVAAAEKLFNTSARA